MQTWHRRIRARGDRAGSVHSGRLERYLGTERVEYLSSTMRGWYGPPIALLDVPGAVRMTGDGDFVGQFDRGYFVGALDALYSELRDLWMRVSHPPHGRLAAGFASVDDALARSSGGFGQVINGQVQKTGPTGVTASSSDLWRLGAMPVAGALGAAPPGGTANALGNTGAMLFTNPAAGTLRLTGADFAATVANNALMLYDRLFSVSPNMNSSATQSVTGVPG